MSYALTTRQAALFTMLASAVNPTEGDFGPNKVRRGVTYPLAYDYVSFPCHLTPSKEIVDPGIVGLEVQDIMDTLDVLRVPIEVRLEAGAYVRLVTPGHPSNGDWYTVQGAAQDMTWRAKTAAYRMKKSTAPPGWPA